MMNIYDKNLAIVRAKEPELARRIEASEDDARIRIKKAAGRPDAIEVTGENGLTARFVKEAVPDSVGRLTERKLFSFGDVAILVGAGIGDTLEAVLKSAGSAGFVLLVESSVPFFKKLIEGWDISHLLADPRVNIAVGENPVDAIMSRLEAKFGIFTRHDFRVIKNGLSVSCFTGYYQQLDRVLEKQTAMAQANLKSISVLSGKWQGNIFANLPYILGKRGIKTLFGRMESIPAIVVSAGPSLDKNCRWLKNAEKSMVIICVDTALKTLIKNGVKPHFVTSLDALMENYSHLEGVDSSGYTLVANPVTYPLILSEHKGDLVITGYTEPLVKWLENFTGDLGQNVTGGSVATAAFDFAYRMGCSPIILAGQDLAYTGGRTHSSGGHKQEMTYNSVGTPVPSGVMHSSLISMDETEEVAGNSGKQLTSNKDMGIWKNWFEIMIAKRSVDCVNATEGGAVINGAKRLCLREAIMFYGRGRVDIRQKINSSALKNVPADVRESVKENLERIAEKTREIKRICSIGIAETEKMQRKAQMKREDGASGSSAATCIALVEAVMKEEEFLEINRWRLENTLDKIRRLQSGIRTSTTAQRSYLNAESYNLFFREVYRTAKEFAKNVYLPDSLRVGAEGGCSVC